MNPLLIAYINRRLSAQSGNNDSEDLTEILERIASLEERVTALDTLTITYDANGGSGEMSDPGSPYHPGERPIILDNAFIPPEGKSFVEWHCEYDGEKYRPGAYMAWPYFGDPLTIILKAVWGSIE